MKALRELSVFQVQQLKMSLVIQTLADYLGMKNTQHGNWDGDNMQCVIDGHGGKFIVAPGERLFASSEARKSLACLQLHSS